MVMSEEEQFKVSNHRALDTLLDLAIIQAQETGEPVLGVVFIVSMLSGDIAVDSNLPNTHITVHVLANAINHILDRDGEEHFVLSPDETGELG